MWSSTVDEYAKIAVRFLVLLMKRIWHFVSSQQILLALLLPAGALIAQLASGNFSVSALRENVWSSLIGYVLAAGIVAVVLIVLAARDLHKELTQSAIKLRSEILLPELQETQSVIVSPVPGVFMASVFIVFIFLLEGLAINAAAPDLILHLPMRNVIEAGLPGPPAAESLEVQEGVNTIPAPISQPEVVLYLPVAVRELSWVPSVDATPRWTPLEKGYPTISIKNLSSRPVVGISVDWLISGTPIDFLFVASEHTKPYGPTIEGGVFTLRGPNGGGFGVPVADRDVTNVPFISGLDSAETEFSSAVWWSFIFRLIATKQRPPTNNVPSGFIKTYGPNIVATVKYSQSNIQYTRAFRIEPMVHAVSDTAGGGGGPIPRDHWSPDNLRAIVRFSVSSVKVGMNP